MRLPGATSVSRCCSDCPRNGAKYDFSVRKHFAVAGLWLQGAAPKTISASRCCSDCPRKGAKYEFAFESTS
eukprot:15521264-Heterocapsa_arctica.AAC.1